MLSPIESARILYMKGAYITYGLQRHARTHELPIPDVKDRFQMVVDFERKFGGIHLPFNFIKDFGYGIEGCLTKEEEVIGRENLGPYYQLMVNAAALHIAFKLNITRKNGILIPA